VLAQLAAAVCWHDGVDYKLCLQASQWACSSQDVQGILCTLSSGEMGGSLVAGVSDVMFMAWKWNVTVDSPEITAAVCSAHQRVYEVVIVVLEYMRYCQRLL
jgi:hypothetical protein